MITLEFNTNRFENDIRSLVMAFYPSVEQKVKISEAFNKTPDFVCNKYDNTDILLRIFQDNHQMMVQYCDNEKVLDEICEDTLSTERKPQKDQLKKIVYRVVSKQLDKKLPWGTLTGIRPTKIARVMLQQEHTSQQIEEHLKETYYISDEKSKLSIQIAQHELDALKDIPYEKEYSIYAGIPFCPSTCAYCSFTSYPVKMWEDRVDNYIESICRELEETTQIFGRDNITSMYVGGGTPTTLSPSQLDRLLIQMRKVSTTSHVRELTVEAGRPDSITREKLEVLQQHGVTRISINPQTMQQKTLDTIGRRHTVKQTMDAFELARSMGFDNINMDLIVGLPGETKQDLTSTLEQIKQLGPDSLTIHSLAIKRAARLNMFKEQFEQYQSLNTKEMNDLTQEYAASMGLKPYYLYRQKNMTGNFENVGYAAKGKAALYNILIMEEMHTIAAVGAGASTKIVYPKENRIERVENVKDVKSYLERLDEMIERKKKAFARELTYEEGACNERKCTAKKEGKVFSR